MNYKHKGSFDWRTTRYRTYARVYVPEGSALTSVIIENGAASKVLDREQVDSGSELDKRWFGVFVSFEPGTEGSIQFVYQLPDSVKKQIDDDLYTLFVQKQAGTDAHELTLELDFGKTITAASPAEKEEKWGDRVYEVENDLRISRDFRVEF